jgi:transcriptional regulator with XRE-family HTH domain
MRGAELKEKLKNSPYSMAELAKMIGVSPQNLNASFSSEDVKSGVLEKLAKALEVPVSFFYGDAYTITGNNIVNSGSNNAVNASDDRLITLLVSKDEQLTMAMKQTTKAQEQMDRILEKFIG